MFHGGKKSILTAGLFVFALGVVAAQPAQTLRVLCVNQSGAYLRLNAVNALTAYLQILSVQKGFVLVVPTSAAETQAKMRDDSLSAYQVVVFNNNTSIGGVITTAAQREAFQRWLKNGGGLVAWHGVMDHADLWPWMRDSVFFTKFTDHSAWNSSGGRSALVRVDTVPTSGENRSRKPEYADIVAGLPKGPWTYPDRWYSLSVNPRNKVDVLMTIDESSYDVVAPMGDHPVAWAYTLPLNPANGKRGRFIYNARGYEAACFTGVGANAAPNDTAGRPNSPTSNFVWQSIRWAAGLTQGSGATDLRSSIAGAGEILTVRKVDGVLKVRVSGLGKYEVSVYSLSGLNVARRFGSGDAPEYVFPGLRSSSVYWVQVRDAKKTYTQRIAF